MHRIRLQILVVSKIIIGNNKEKVINKTPSERRNHQGR